MAQFALLLLAPAFGLGRDLALEVDTLEEFNGWFIVRVQPAIR